MGLVYTNDLEKKKNLYQKTTIIITITGFAQNENIIQTQLNKKPA